MLTKKHGPTEVTALKIRPITSKTHIEHLALSMSERTWNLLKRNGLRTLGDFRHKTEEQMMKIEKFGIVSLKEVMAIMAQAGVSFKQS